jgi:hypothetical protein
VKLSAKGSSLMESLVMVAIFLIVAAIAVHKALIPRDGEHQAVPVRAASQYDGSVRTRAALLSIASKH